MLVACIAGSSVVFLDEFVVNVALPAIQSDLGGGLAGQQWVSNAYLLALGSLLLVGGSLGDVFGERRVFALGVAGFGVMSVACALAPTLEALIAARAVQGIAGAVHRKVAEFLHEWSRLGESTPHELVVVGRRQSIRARELTDLLARTESPTASGRATRRRGSPLRKRRVSAWTTRSRASASSSTATM